MTRVASHHGPRPRGFTLVELVVTIGIIAILVVLTVTAFGVLSERSQVSATQATMRILETAVDEYESSIGRGVRLSLDQTSYGTDWEMTLDVAHGFSVTQLLQRIGRSEAARAVIAGIDPGAVAAYDSGAATQPLWIRAADPEDPDLRMRNAATLTSDVQSGAWDGTAAVLDSWGRPIRAVHPGPATTSGAFDGLTATWLASPLVSAAWNLSNLDEDRSIYLTNSYPFPTEYHYGVCRGQKILFVSAGPDGRFGSLNPAASAAQRARAADNVYSYDPEGPR